jgi:hypothetical protein
MDIQEKYEQLPRAAQLQIEALIRTLWEAQRTVLSAAQRREQLVQTSVWSEEDENILNQAQEKWGQWNIPEW